MKFAVALALRVDPMGIVTAQLARPVVSACSMLNLQIRLDCSPYERVANLLRWNCIVEVVQGQDSSAVVLSSVSLRHLQQRFGRAEDSQSCICQQLEFGQA
jgi:hypothetical protein